MAGHSDLSRHGKWFVTCVVASGAAAVGHAAYSIATQPVGDAWLILAALTLFSGSFTVKVPSIPATISVSETFVFTAVLLFGTGPATLIVALDGVIITLWQKRRRLHRVLFNATEPAVSIWAAGSIFFTLTDYTPLVWAPTQPIVFSQLALPLVVLTATYFLLNSSLTAIAVSLETRTPPIVVWKRHFLWLSVNYFGGASVALLLAKNAPGLDPTSPGVVLSALSIILPLLVISYLTFRTAMGRIEDTTVHLTELNSLYLSVIEALATTIDARDHTTHGHIRRVQNQALALAKHLGVSQPELLRAIEAAALLHDLGKLQVPEHILNKPGRLTHAEFETIKTHARAGADILSSIEFPYPVVPIVRHHHENWDGTGYPDGIEGTNIPIGARILTVVDCYDALTSTRPYRRALSDEAACKILLSRRGSMYDPVVVDAFISTRCQAASQSETCGETAHARCCSESRSEGTATDECRPCSDLAAFTDNRDTSSGETDLQPAFAENGGWCSALLRLALAATAADVAVLYVHSDRLGELRSALAEGLESDAFRGHRIPLVGTVSGWTAVNRRIVLDADPATDLMCMPTADSSSIRSAVAIPVLLADQPLSVLTLYSVTAGAFKRLDRVVVEALAPGVSIETGGTASDSPGHNSEMAPFGTSRNQPSLPSDERPLAEEWSVVASTADRRSTACILVTIPASPPGLRFEGTDVVREFGRRLVAAIEASVRPQDIVVRISETELGVLVQTAWRSQATVIEARIRLAVEALRTVCPSLPIDRIRIGLSRQGSTEPDLPSLLTHARNASRPMTSAAPPSPVQ